MGKKLLTREQVNEAWSPVLTGATIGSPGTYNHNNLNANTGGNYVGGVSPNIDYGEFGAMFGVDRPANLGPCETDTFTDPGEPYPVPNKYYLSATYINGHPLTDWSAQFMNQPGYMSKQTHLANLYNIYMSVKDQIKNKINLFLPKPTIDEININNIKIIKIEKTNNIDISYTLTFDLNDRKNIFCQFFKFNTSSPEFICSELTKLLSKEQLLKIEGKLLNSLKEYLTPDNGYYILLSKEFYTFNKFGQIEKLKEGDVIEVIKSNDFSITYRKNNEIYIIKKPDYYYFNWVFTKK